MSQKDCVHRRCLHTGLTGGGGGHQMKVGGVDPGLWLQMTKLVLVNGGGSVGGGVQGVHDPQQARHPQTQEEDEEEAAALVPAQHRCGQMKTWRSAVL